MGKRLEGISAKKRYERPTSTGRRLSVPDHREVHIRATERPPPAHPYGSNRNGKITGEDAGIGTWGTAGGNAVSRPRGNPCGASSEHWRRGYYLTQRCHLWASIHTVGSRILEQRSKPTTWLFSVVRWGHPVPLRMNGQRTVGLPPNGTRLILTKEGRSGACCNVDGPRGHGAERTSQTQQDSRVPTRRRVPSRQAVGTEGRAVPGAGRGGVGRVAVRWARVSVSQDEDVPAIRCPRLADWTAHFRWSRRRI